MAINGTTHQDVSHQDLDMDTSDYSKPVPRDPKSPTKQAEVVVRNRRREYLQRHPSYFVGIEHELAGI